MPYNFEGEFETVEVTMDTGPSQSQGITHKRIYRTATGSTGVTTYRFVAEIAVATAAHEDSLLGNELGEGIVTEGWSPPHDDLDGIIGLPNGVLVGFVGKDIYYSEPYQPHAWPDAYVQTGAIRSGGPRGVRHNHPDLHRRNAVSRVGLRSPGPWLRRRGSSTRHV